MKNKSEKLNLCEHCLSIFTKIRPGEGWAVILFSLYAMVLMVCYYIFKTLRETLILTSFSAEVRSYAAAVIAVIAVLLFFIIPLYGMLFRSTHKVQVMRWITLFFAGSIVVFYFMGRAGMQYICRLPRWKNTKASLSSMHFFGVSVIWFKPGLFTSALTGLILGLPSLHLLI